MKRSEAVAVRTQIEHNFSIASGGMTADEIISSRVLCKKWTPGNHTAGEVYSTGVQIWQCIQDYNNAVYPDITPQNAAWGTFNKPYHGTTKKTALPWVQPTGAHDMYLTRECMVWTDCLVYQCQSSTAFSPAEFEAAWKIVE